MIAIIHFLIWVISVYQVMFFATLAMGMVLIVLNWFVELARTP